MCEQPNWRDPNAFFRTIAAQTSIRFDREPRQTGVWFMVDDNKAQPRTQSTAATD
ncbi:MAG TPA: hypothetical protein VN541_19855 [Tepidisphaeraceae bacterium]|nr:hypothetical protein [Tepidisphaeraceae bacterium]